MMKSILILVACVLINASPASGQNIESAVENEVADVERAFAKSMADRDFATFSSFIAEDTVFVSGPQVLRGKASVIAAWKPFFEGSDPAPQIPGFDGHG